MYTLILAVICIPANSHALGVSLTPEGWKLRSHARSRLRTNSLTSDFFGNLRKWSCRFQKSQRSQDKSLTPTSQKKLAGILYVASRVQRNGGWTVLTFLLSWSVCAVNFFCLLNPLFFIFNTLVIKLPNATGHYTCSRVACFLDPDSCYREQHASHSYSGKWCHLNVQFNKSGYC